MSNKKEKEPKIRVKLKLTYEELKHPLTLNGKNLKKWEKATDKLAKKLRKRKMLENNPIEAPKVETIQA